MVKARSLKDVQTMIAQRTNYEYQVLAYTNSSSRITYLHTTCGNEFTKERLKGTQPEDLKCPLCSKKKELIKRGLIYKISLIGSDYILMSDYLGSQKQSLFYHKSCKQTFKVRARSIKYLKCTKCENGKPKSEISQEKINYAHGEGVYKIIRYAKATDIDIQHSCGYIKTDTEVNVFHNKDKTPACPKCEGGTIFWTPKTFSEAFYKAMGTEYKILEDFTRSGIPLLIKHLRCGKVYTILPHHALKGNQCRECTYDRIHNGKWGSKWFYERKDKLIDGHEYIPVTEFKNTNKNITFLHTECGREFTVNAGAFINLGTRCRFCRKSKAEKRIAIFLQEKGYSFVEQATFDDCRNIESGRKLRFDFVLYNEQQERISIIEYDGIQHFVPIDFYGGEEQMKIQQHRDKLKDEYCKKMKIPFLRINYKSEENIEEILEKYLATL